MCIRISEMRKKDQEKKKIEKAKNDLETFIIDGQDKLYQDKYVTCSKEEERADLTAKFSAASDWLYEQEEDTPRKVWDTMSCGNQSGLHVNKSIYISKMM